MVAFYKHSIVDWRSGTCELSDRAYRVYHVIVEEIMLNEGPVPLHERSLAGKANRSVRDFRAAMDELVAAGKLTVRDGFVGNSRCENELNGIRTNRQHASNGGRKSGEVRRKDKDINATDEAPLHSDANIKEKRRGEEEENRETSSLVGSPRVEHDEVVIPIGKPKAKSGYPEAFERFWQAYPTDTGMSKKEAHAAWAKLSPEQREQALAAVPGWIAWAGKQRDYRMLHACRFLSQRRFETVAASAPAQPVALSDAEKRERTVRWWMERHGMTQTEAEAAYDERFGATA